MPDDGRKNPIDEATLGKYLRIKQERNNKNSHPFHCHASYIENRKPRQRCEGLRL